MSLILEALRKSEQQRRLGEVPTLGSDSAWAARRWHGAPSRARRWPWVLGALLLAGAGGAGWWAVGSRDGTPAPATETSAPTATTSPVDAPPAPTAQPPAGATAGAVPPPAAIPAPAPAPAPAAPPAAPVVPAAIPAPPPAPQAATDAPDIRLEAPTPQVDGEYPAAAAAEPPPVAAAPPATDATIPPPAAAPAPGPAEVPAPAPPQPVPAAPTVPPASAAPAADGLPLVYALPLATRQALPPLKLAMHVWNADPARRFVILGETRAAEGETAAQDVQVVEIRRDGVVLEFRGTRFLLPRAGW